MTRASFLCNFNLFHSVTSTTTGSEVMTSLAKIASLLRQSGPIYRRMDNFDYRMANYPSYYVLHIQVKKSNSWFLANITKFRSLYSTLSTRSRTKWDQAATKHIQLYQTTAFVARHSECWLGRLVQNLDDILCSLGVKVGWPLFSTIRILYGSAWIGFNEIKFQ